MRLHDPEAPTRWSLLALVALAAAALAGCPSTDEQPPARTPVLEITAPAPGELITTTQVTVRGRAEHTDEVMVEDRPASVVGGVWSAQVPIDEGEVTVEVTARGASESVDFVVDVSPPQLEVTSPERAAYVLPDQGTSVQVRGRVEEPLSELDALIIGGQRVTPGEGGAFDHEHTLRPGLNVIEIEARDTAGNQTRRVIGVMHGPVTDPTEPIDPGLDLFIDEATFPRIAAVVQQLLTPAYVEELIAQNLDVEGVSIESVDFAPLQIEATPRSNRTNPGGPGRIDFEITARQVELVGDFELSGNPIGLEVTVAEATVTTSLTVQADGEGSVDLSFGDSALDLEPGAISWRVTSGGGELDESDSDLLAGIIEDIARFAFSELLSDQIFEQLYDPALLERNIELLGRTLSFSLRIQQVITNASGVLVRATLAMPAEEFAGLPEVPGALARERGTTQASSLGSNAVATTDRTALDRLLHGVWRSGLLHQTLVGDDFAGYMLPVELEAGALALALDGRVTNHADTSSPAGIRLRPQLPPVLELAPGEEGTGLIGQIGELHVDVLLEADSPSPKTLVTLAVFLEMGVDLTIEETTLAFDVDVTGQVDVADEPLFDMDDEATEELLNGVIALAPQILTEALEVGGEADLPWFTVTDPQVEIHGIEQNQVSVGLSIELAEDSAPEE